MIVISPWTKGGYVNSEVFDHTSLIRFIEARFAQGNPELIESNITPWRRAVSGDLTSAFNFKNPNNKVVALPNTAAYVPPTQDRYPDYVPTVPANQALPTQEPGTRLARAVPYELHVAGAVNVGGGSFGITYGNAGKTVVYQTRSGNSSQGPWTYTVGSGEQVADSYPISGSGLSGYDLTVYGPNGFLRAFRGSLAGANTVQLDVRVAYEKVRNAVTLSGKNLGSHSVKAWVTDVYSGKTVSVELGGGERAEKTYELHPTHGWYDFVITAESDPTFQYQLAGHVETGEESRTDPAIGRV
jgi:phospholipase C